MSKPRPSFKGFFNVFKLKERSWIKSRALNISGFLKPVTACLMLLGPIGSRVEFKWAVLHFNNYVVVNWLFAGKNPEVTVSYKTAWLQLLNVLLKDTWGLNLVMMVSPLPTCPILIILTSFSCGFHVYINMRKSKHFCFFWDKCWQHMNNQRDLECI